MGSICAGGLLKGIVYQADILAFLSHPAEAHPVCAARAPRLREVDLRLCGDSAEPGRPRDRLDHLDRDVPAGRRPGPARHGPQRPDAASRAADRRLAAFRREWFGQILDRYRGSPTRIVFVRLPRGPDSPPRQPGAQEERSIREFASRPSVLLCDEHAFDSLERPELFKDALI